MNPELTKLQVLNDLIAQTIDVIAQRNLGMPVSASWQRPMVGGLSHTPYQQPNYNLGGFVMPTQLQHTSYHPQAGFFGMIPGMEMNRGFTHSPMSLGFGWNHTPQHQLVPGWNAPVQFGGLSHTAYDPRYGFMPTLPHTF